MKINVVAGGENRNPIEIETDDIADVTPEAMGDRRVGFRLDVLLHMKDGQIFRISPDQWEEIRRQLHP